jgi:hypothetical protein
VARRTRLTKVASIATVIRRLEFETDELESLAERLRALAYHLDRHRARALKQRRRRRAT